MRFLLKHISLRHILSKDWFLIKRKNGSKDESELTINNSGNYGGCSIWYMFSVLELISLSKVNGVKIDVGYKT